TGHTDAVTALVFASSQQLLSVSLDGTVKVWQALPGPMRLLRGHTGPVVSLVISRDGTRLLSGSGWPQGAKSARVWDFQTGKELHVFRAQRQTDKEPTQIHAVGLSPDGKRAVSAGFNGMVFLWDVETGKEQRRFQGHDGEINALDFSPDGRHMLSG